MEQSMKTKPTFVKCETCGCSRTKNTFASPDMEPDVPPTTGCTHHFHKTSTDFKSCPKFRKSKTDKGIFFCHCDFSDNQSSPAPSNVPEPSKAPSPSVGKQLPAGFSMGPQPHAISPPSSPPPFFNAGVFPPMMPPNSDVFKEILSLTKTVNTLESRCMCLEQENSALKQGQDSLFKYMQAMQEQLTALAKQNAELVAIVQARDSNKAGKTAAIQHPKPKHYIKPHSNDKERKEHPHYRKPYNKGPKKVIDEPQIPDSPTKRIDMTSVTTPVFSAEDLETPSNWGDSIEESESS